ncbi:hypothetical protein UCRPC4_g03835 [Phaeomoniella chlamydospora]|uniref:Uncharacterized protein n=1 Tax=Phaeomoniella chlamydospora TaxID=158046 RepID=A0A0G2EFA8_PHACM|nr:hypothetical protein UCRPC4_g03835 [Phaeomoniella chlamydospora]
MGKTPGMKKKSQSKHSRAARRAASPSLDVDKSILSLGRPISPSDNNPTGQNYSALSAKGTNGVSKTKKNKKESRNQRLRREKGLERAEAKVNILEVKREKSKNKVKVIKDRSRPWEEVDEKSKTDKSKSKGSFEALADQMDEDEWEDEPETEKSLSLKDPRTASTGASVSQDITAVDMDEIS